MQRDGTKAGGRMASKPFGGYVRVSRVGERDERLRSPQFQTTGIEAKARAEGVAVEMYEPELDVSGSKKSRAILDAIVERVERKELAGVIVYNLSRLSRLAPRDRLELVERIEKAGGVILSASESFDASTPEGRFQRDLFFSMARLEWEKAREGWHAAKANAIAEGRAVKRRVNFGYERGKGGKLVPVPGDADVVRTMFERRAEGGSWGDLLDVFEEATGRSSSRQTMREMIGNRVYRGDLEYGRTAATRLENRGAHTAIVSEVLFAAAQAVTTERAGAPRQRTGRAKSLLAGIVTCQGCGRPLQRDRKRDRFYYRCPTDAKRCAQRALVATDELDAYVLGEVIAWAGPVADELVELELELGSRGDRIVLEHRLAEAERTLVEYEADVERELEIGRAAYDAGRKARVELVTKRRAELDAVGEASELELVRGTLRQVLADDGEYDVDERRTLLRSAIAGIVVRRTPRRGAPASERATITFRDAADASTSVTGEDATELLEHATA